MKEGRMQKILQARGQILEAVSANRQLASKQVLKEAGWNTYDSALDRMAVAFDTVLPAEFTKGDTVAGGFKTYIESMIPSKDTSKKRNLYGLEIGGPGSRFFEGFTKGFFAKTLGVCLRDIRRESRKNNDEQNSHSVIVENALGNQGSDH